MANFDLSSLDQLRIADPDTYVWVKGRLDLLPSAPTEDVLAILSETTIWGLSQEAGLGKAVAEGLLRLMPDVPDERLLVYVRLVRKAAETGETLGGILATYLPPVVKRDDDFLAHFQSTLEIMLDKGTYTLNAPLEVMAELLDDNDEKAASVYLELLAATFEQKISYNQSLRLVYLLPKAVSDLTPQRRRFQIQQLLKIARIDLVLVGPFLDGLEKESGLLDKKALEEFVNQALRRYCQSPEASIKFLNLSSKFGRDVCTSLGRAVPLTRMRSQLNRYLNARLGRRMAVKPLSELPKSKSPVLWICSDGRHIFLPDEIDIYPSQDENANLYKALVRFEAGFFEFGTFDFDLERAVECCSGMDRSLKAPTIEDSGDSLCDAQRFINSFHPHRLADDLFNIIERARVARQLRQSYPGLVKQVLPFIQNRLEQETKFDAGHLLAPLYAELVLAVTLPYSKNPDTAAVQSQIVSLCKKYDGHASVEDTAVLVYRSFALIAKTVGRELNSYLPLTLPFEARLHWDMVGSAYAAQDQAAVRVKMRLKEKGFDVYKADLRRRLEDQQNHLSVDDITELVLARAGRERSVKLSVDLEGLDLEKLLQQSGAALPVPPKLHGEAFCYPEWDHYLQDYLYDHTRVYEIEVSADGDNDFYTQTLARHQGVVSHMRRAFELIKPEGLAMLRQWPEGDDFDYRALIDFAIDRRAGRIPSDRLFIKRLKQERDVAAMLLVDISRSTANSVSSGDMTVLDVTKEALVLFCEALQVVGDDYAIAGFSGTGRHSVDFYTIKNFQEPFDEKVQSRISALKPQRSTRMGAAIRHAVALLSQTDAKVRLIIVVSDGFPNDLGYKADYAIADTRRAVQEARSRNFYTKAITVNIGNDPRLDDLYGRAHHHVIGDVRELPDKLLRLYGALTRL